MVVINELLLKIPCKKSVLSDHIEIDRLQYFIFSSFGTFQVNWPDFLSIKIYLDFIDYRYCNSGKGDLYRRRFIDQKRPVCVKGSHESLVSIWVQICQQNALTVNPFRLRANNTNSLLAQNHHLLIPFSFWMVVEYLAIKTSLMKIGNSAFPIEKNIYSIINLCYYYIL